jgi:ATP-dependent RNA helicase SUPV3L1/SUV3
METAERSDRGSHQEIVTAAREELIAELGIEGTPLAEEFIALPVGPKVRASGVRTQLAQFTAERLVAIGRGLRADGFNETQDEIKLLLPATLDLREGLAAPVFGSIGFKFAPLVRDVATRGAPAVVAEVASRRDPQVTELTRSLREKAPSFEGWDRLTSDDIRRAFGIDPPLLSQRKELFSRLRAACTHAADRALLDDLAKRNPGFIDYLQCFPVARSMHRKVVAWLGPTNSGKTHRAILALREAESGMYLGPLRLLALEQRDRLNELGQPCSLITGEERDEASETHSARTVEMTDFSRRFDVCVLDEMQLAFDRDRGWAWVAAYCGVAAKTLIVTGPVSAEPVIRRLAEVCGDELEVNYLERQGTLLYEGVLDWRNVPARSAVIGFSRAMVLELKAMFEARGRRVSVIYGGLSPEVRREEARRFRAGESDIVCATDAIGLGLNLPIDRVIFYEVDKFDGEEDRPLTPGELLQIAGRAGRGPGSAGLAAAFSARDGRRLSNALSQPQTTPQPDRLPAAPTAMHVRAIADHLGMDRLSLILEFFVTRLTFPGGTFFPEVQDDVFAAAELVDTFAASLPVETRYTLACAPIDLEEHLFRTTYSEWLEALAAGATVSFPRRITTTGGLESLEEVLKLITAYRWLALKFPAAFTDVPHVEQMRREATEIIQSMLRKNWGKQGLSRRECSSCRRALLPSSPYNTCRSCYRESFG